MIHKNIYDLDSDSYKICVGLGVFLRAWNLTNCASYDTLAKLTRPGGIYEVLMEVSIRF